MHLFQRSTSESRLERFLGPVQLEALSQAGKDWYGPPIPLVGVPGGVHLRGGPGGGDFIGPIDAGAHAHLFDFVEARFRSASRRWSRNQMVTCNAGFASLGDLIAEATTGGKKRVFNYSKVGVTGVVGATNTLWYEPGTPAGGGPAGAAPAGSVCNDSTTGGFPFTNPTGGDQQFFTAWMSAASVVSNTLLLYDRLFAVEKTMNSTANEAVTGVPSRYQNTTGGNPDSVAGNFLFIECRAALPATAHNWDTNLYTNQAGTGGQTLPTVTGNSSCIAKRLDQPVQQWFCPLAPGDTGIKELTQMHCSALVASGNIAFVIGHPIAMIAHPVINMMWPYDGVTGLFNLNRIFDDACLAFLEVVKPATNATTYTGFFETVSG